MKTRIYLPVLSILALMLLSFTTNQNEKGSIKQLADGNYVLQNVPLEKEDIYKIDQMAERISIYDKLNEDTAARGFWIFKNKKTDDTKFTQKTLLGRDIIAYLNKEDLGYLEKVNGEIDGMMERYMK